MLASLTDLEPNRTAPPMCHSPVYTFCHSSEATAIRQLLERAQCISLAGTEQHLSGYG